MNITCPQCKKITPWEANPWRPFCSERCKMIDLGKWASEEYTIPGENSMEEDEETKKKEDDKSEQGNLYNKHDMTDKGVL